MSLLFSSMLFKIYQTMFKYILIFEYMTIFNQQLSSTFVVIKIKTDYKYLTLIKHLPNNTFDLFRIIQIVWLLTDANALTSKFQGLCHVKINSLDNYLWSQIGYVICSANATNKTNIYLLFIKCILVICSVLSTKLYVIAYKFEIKKQHWGRYQIVQKKLYQH